MTRSFEKPFESFMNGDKSKAHVVRGNFIAATGEFVGTFFFLFFAYACHVMAVEQAGEIAPNGANSAQTVIFISLGYGMSLLVSVWILFRVSGGLFNPAVTLGLVVARQLDWKRGLCLFPAQILGAMVAAGLIDCMIPGPISVTRTTLAPGMSPAQGVFFEMFLTSFLVFTVLMLAAEKSKDTFIAPLGIGLALFVAEIAGVYYTGASLNPARSFAPCVAARSFESYHYIYWFGPIMGALIAAGYFRFVKFFNYEEANPGQDSADGDFQRE